MANQTSDNSPEDLTPDLVGISFLKEYYGILHSAPEHSHKFYEDTSVLARPEPDGIMTSATTMKGIKDKIMSLGYKDCIVEIKFVHSQQSCNQGVIVGVVGFLTGKDSVCRQFTQTFFLAPTEKGYFVMNDFLFFIPTHKQSSPSPVDDVDKHAPTTPLTLDPAEEVSVNGSNVSVQSETKVPVVEEAVVPKPLPNSSEDKVLPVSNSAANGREDSPKTSYASILAKERALEHVPAHVVRVSANADQQPPKNQQHPMNQQSHPSAKPEANDAQVEAKGVFVRGLPTDITYDLFFDALSKFGPLDRRNIQILSYADGFRCGFANFDSSVSAENAVEASEVLFGDKVAQIEWKKPKFPRGVNNNRARFPSGRGDLRDENGRGGENFGEPRNGRWERNGKDSYNYGDNSRPGKFDGQRERERNGNDNYKRSGGKYENRGLGFVGTVSNGVYRNGDGKEAV